MSNPEWSELYKNAEPAWSKLVLQPGELLLVKVNRKISAAAVSKLDERLKLILGDKHGQVLIYFEDSLEFTKVSHAKT